MDPNSLTFAGLPLLLWIPLLPLIGALLNLVFGSRLSKSTVSTIAVASVVAAFGVTDYMVFGLLGLTVAGIATFVALVIAAIGLGKPTPLKLAVALVMILLGAVAIWVIWPHLPRGPLWLAYESGGGGTGIEQNVYTWLDFDNFKAQLAFRLDTLSAVMILIVTFVGSLIHIYSTGYMAHDPGYARYFGYLNLFTGAMLVLVLAANLPVMFIGWEGVGLCSFLLIGFWYEKEEFATAGRKAFVVNRIGDFCFLLGMFLLFWAVKSLDFADLKSQANGPAFAQGFLNDRLAATAGILLFIGACGKSAQLPLFVWLPDAMAGPTPVSALIHAATMVTAGVYMVCRLSFLYSVSTTAMGVVAVVGMLTALVAAFIALTQNDLKKVLAYSTVSQLGFMFVAAGTGNWVAAIFHLGTHAFFKACLFLGAGSVMHGMEHGGSHTPGDITTMGGLRRVMPITRITFAVSCLAISGIFPFSGFWSKDEILSGAWGVGMWSHYPPGWPFWLGKLLWVGLLVAALGTAFYMWRLYFLVFGGEPRSDAARGATESPVSMTGALVVLAVFATVVGVLGLPELTGVHLPHMLASWLEPSVTPSWYVPGGAPIEIRAGLGDTTTYVLMGLALAIGVLGIAVAWVFYGGRAPSPSLAKVPDSPTLGGIYSASKHKLWFDEIYDALIVRPFRVLARGLFEIVDRFIIDTVAVNGIAFVVGLFGRLSRWFQNGQVQRYLVGVVLGAAAVFLVTNCNHKPDFDYDYDAKTDMFTFHAHPGAGLIGEVEAKSARLQWDFDGDGKPDVDASGHYVTGVQITKRAGEVGGKVTLWIDDPVTQQRVEITHTVRLPEDQP